jgi:two-component system nitrate/nitrite response regulator NarL
MRCASLALIGSSGIIAEGLKSLLSGSNFRIKHQHRSLAEFWKSARGGEGSLSGIILDANNHPPFGSSDLDDIRRWSAAVKIVLMADDSRFREIMPVAHDADCVILTSTAGAALLKALELVLLGQRVYPAGLFQGTGAPKIFHDVDHAAIVPACDDTPELGPTNGSRNALPNLSEREVQVVNLLRKGNPNKIIARNLGISEATVKVHVKAILRKTHARNRTEAALLFSSAMGSNEGTV